MSSDMIKIITKRLVTIKSQISVFNGISESSPSKDYIKLISIS